MYPSKDGVFHADFCWLSRNETTNMSQVHNQADLGQNTQRKLLYNRPKNGSRYVNQIQVYLALESVKSMKKTEKWYFILEENMAHKNDTKAVETNGNAFTLNARS